MKPNAPARPPALRWLAAALVAATCAQPAHADSIVFIKEHNVWIANPDGSGARALTADGDADRPYRSPSQADDGRISAGHRTEIVQLDRQGGQLARFQPDVAVSADGAKVAYTVYGHSCVIGLSCGSRQMTGYVSADGTASHGYELGLTGPEWISGDTVLGFGGLFRQVLLDAIGTANSDATVWFNDPGNFTLRDGELSRQGDRLALLRDEGDAAHLVVFAVPAAHEAPRPACMTDAEATLDDPTWSPDGTRLAFAHAEGIEVLSLPVVTAGECPGAQSVGVVIPGGSEPDWGPADVQPPYTITADPVRGAKLRKALRKGLKLTVATNVAGTLAGGLLVDGRQVASGAASLAPGTGSITFRFTKAARKRLARRKAVAFVAELTFTTDSGAVVPVNGTVELKR
jgi:hypothetical protein